MSLGRKPFGTKSAREFGEAPSWRPDRGTRIIGTAVAGDLSLVETHQMAVPCPRGICSGIVNASDLSDGGVGGEL